VDDEIAFHIEMRTRELVEQGFPSAEAAGCGGTVRTVHRSNGADRQHATPATA